MPTTLLSWVAGFTPLFVCGTLYAARALINSETDNWADLARKAGMTLD